MRSNTQLIESFVTYMRAERRLSAHTVSNYQHDVTDFSAYFGKPITTAARTDLLRYNSEAFAAGISARTVARRMSALKLFFRFLGEEEETESDPTRNLPIPKTWKTVPKSLKAADVDKMIRSLGPSWIDVRDKAMLLLLFGSGLRESELINLKIEDLDLDGSAVKVWNGKGGKDAVLPLSSQSIAALKLYIETVRPELSDSGGQPYVFLSKRRRLLTRMAVWARVHQIASATIGRHVSPHSLRHSYATSLVEGGADIRDVQALMRHASVDTTAVYLHTDLSYLKRNFYASSPRARIAKAQG